MEIFGLSITLLSIVIAYLAWNNGKWMKETLRIQTEMLNEIKNLIVEESRASRELIETVAERLSTLIVAEKKKTR